jgi:ribosomal protein S18 acetylase RimI-like enzyme
VRDEDLYIGGLQILPEYRGKWIGTTILERLIEESKETLKSIRLEVFHSNTLAFKLYKKLDFRVIDSNQIQKIMVYQPTHPDR